MICWGNPLQIPGYHSVFLAVLSLDLKGVVIILYKLSSYIIIFEEVL